MDCVCRINFKQTAHKFEINIPDKNKFLTTFNEKASAKSTLAIRLPHELKKFQNLRILDIAAGLHHILLLAVSKISPTNSLDITSSDANENIPVHTLLPEKSDASVENVENQKRSIESLQQNIPDFKNIISSKPILVKEGVQSTQTNTLETNKEGKPAEIKESQSELSDQVERMDLITKSVANIGDNLMNEIKSIAATGEEKLNDLAKETEKTVMEVPKNVIDYVKTSMGVEKPEENNENIVDVTNEASLNRANEILGTPPSNTTNLNEPDKDENIKQINTLNRTSFDDLKNDSVDNEVKFINDGTPMDASSTSNIIQAMNDEINEMSSDAKNKADELTMKYDGMINNELSGAKEAISTKMFEMKNGEIILEFFFECLTLSQKSDQKIQNCCNNRQTIPKKLVIKSP